MTPLRQRMLDELQRRNYTPDTIRGYIHAIKDFAEYFGKSPELMGADEVREFQLYMIREKKLALGTVALRMGALRFLYKKTLRRRDIDIDDLPLVRAPKKLPVVLSQEEVVRLIEAALNLRHRTILMLLYATGLRRAEAVHLKISNIDTALMLIHVHQGKGSRDRDLPLTQKLLEALREYWQWCKNKPRTYLFPSRVEPIQPDVPSPIRSCGMPATRQRFAQGLASASGRTCCDTASAYYTTFPIRHSKAIAFATHNAGSLLRNGLLHCASRLALYLLSSDDPCRPLYDPRCRINSFPDETFTTVSLTLSCSAACSCVTHPPRLWNCPMS